MVYAVGMKDKHTESQQRQAVLWGRFSSDKQADGDSRDSQYRYNTECAKRRRIEVVGDYFDEGISVKDGATPNFLAMLATLPKGVGIICRDLDRISRGHPIDSLHFVKHSVIGKGHFVITSTDDIEYNQDTINEGTTTAIGQFKSTIAYGENEKRKRGVRDSQNKRIEMARQGKPSSLGAWLPAYVSYNFDTGQYDYKKDIIATIKRVFDAYVSGKGTGEITRALNKDNTPTLAKKKAGAWTRGSVGELLRYEGVIGVLNINGERIANAWKPAISETLFYQVQKMLAKNKSRHTNATTSVNNVLRGLCKCTCGASLRVFKGKYLGCTGYRDRKRNENGEVCEVKNLVPWKPLERDFLRWFIPVAEKELLNKDNSQVSRINALQTKLDTLSERIKDTYDLMDFGLGKAEAKERLGKLEAERTTTLNSLNEAKAEQSQQGATPDAIRELKQLLHGAIDGNQSIRERIASIVPKLIESCTIDISDKRFPSFQVILANGQHVSYAGTLVDYYGVDAYREQ